MKPKLKKANRHKADRLCCLVRMSDYHMLILTAVSPSCAEFRLRSSGVSQGVIDINDQM